MAHSQFKCFLARLNVKKITAIALFRINFIVYFVLVHFTSFRFRIFDFDAFDDNDKQATKHLITIIMTMIRVCRLRPCRYLFFHVNFVDLSPVSPSGPENIIVF